MSLDDTPISDDYIASLLSSRADADHKGYLKSGVGAFRSLKGRPRNAPKPNARFLKNLIRDTDSHNNALLASEAEKSQGKLDNLKRTRREDDTSAERSSKRRVVDEKPARWAAALGGLGGKERARSKKALKVDATDRQDMQERASYEDRRPSRSPSRREKHRERRGHHHQNDNIKRSHSHRARSRSASPKRTRHHSRYVSITSNSDEGADSDPLVDVIGPAKPSNSKPRGRGASKSAFDSIDARFAPDYDPIADVRLNDDDDTASVDKDDWDMALEALRDRQRYKSTQEARLKAAGFSEREIDRWRNSDGSEIHEEDVKWSKRGEAREWDRGKANLL